MMMLDLGAITSLISLIKGFNRGCLQDITFKGLLESSV
jgi:hypothetical protein